MVRYRGLIVAGVMLTAIAVLGTVVFVQTAQPVSAAGSSAMMAGAMGGSCPATGASEINQSCQEIHNRFLTDGDLTAADYNRILDEISDSQSLTCLTSQRSTADAKLEGVI